MIFSLRKAGYGLLCMVVIALLMMGPAVAADQAPIKVGLLTPMTGPSPDWGKKQVVGVELALEKVNLRGGVNGIPVKMFPMDTGGDPEMALSAYRNLAESDGVVVVIGPFMTRTFAALQPVSNEEKLCIIATASAKPGLCDLQKHPYAFRMTVTSDKTEGASAKAWAKAHSIKSVVILFEGDDPYCAPIAEKLWPNTFGQMNIKVLNDGKPIPYDENQSDFSVQLNRIAQLNPDGICIAGMPPETAKILKAMRSRGLKQPVLGSSSVATETVINIAGKAAEGLVSNTLFNPGDPNPKVAGYIQKFQERCKKTYTDVSCQSDQFDVVAYDILQFLVDIMKKKGVTGDPAQLQQNRDRIRDGLANMKMWRGTSGMMAFDKKGEGIRTIHIMQVKDGKWQPTY